MNSQGFPSSRVVRGEAVSEPKPLSKERREYLKQFTAWPPDQVHVDAVRDVIEAEQFWREAVKKSEPLVWDDEGGECFFCTEANTIKGTDHKSDCPWKLAQE